MVPGDDEAALAHDRDGVVGETRVITAHQRRVDCLLDAVRPLLHGPPATKET
jgi:hypothetical protein